MSKEDFQPEILEDNERNLEVKRKFTAIFKRDAEFYVRVPGRVNLIGEHIDYSGYGVCPMALKQDIFLAVATTTERTLQLRNTNCRYDSHDCFLNEINVMEGNPPQWYQYFLCGVKGIVETMPPETRLKGLKVMVNGTIPQSAGLSSSSALVCAAALATAFANQIKLSREEIASICAKSERYIGTEGGGMDQAIAFLATKGCAKLINFNPLRAEDVRLPAGAVFVIAHSLAELNKAATSHYNCRVVECRLAAQMLAVKNGVSWKEIRNLGQIQSILKVDLMKMIEKVERQLHDRVYTLEEILGELKVTRDELSQVSFTANTADMKEFKLKHRALHVYQEALRVQKFHEQCAKHVDAVDRDEEEGQSDTDSTLEALGELMSESHDSLRDLYECSHPDLDRIVEISRKYVLGARLTGAGWGGCAVALVRPENIDNYIDALKKLYYYNNTHNDANNIVDIESILFTTEPQTGATVYIDRIN